MPTFSSSASAQDCPKPPINLENYQETCTFAKGDKDRPSLITSQGSQCSLPIEALDPTLLAGPATTFSGAAPSLEFGCIAHVKLGSKETLFVDLPPAPTTETWRVSSNDQKAFQIIRLLPPKNSLVIQFDTTKPATRWSYQLNGGESTLDLAPLITSRFGMMRVSDVQPNVVGLTAKGLTLVYQPVPNSSVSQTLSVTVGNDYGKTATINVLLVPGAFYSDSPTIKSLKLELTLVRKLAADEKYMRIQAPTGMLDDNSAKGLLELYQRAADTLPLCDSASSCTELSKSDLATLKLLKADIAYRRTLIDKRLTFWGGFRTLRPTTPHQQVIRLRELLKRLDEATNRLERWQFRAQDKTERAQEIAAEKAYVSGQVKAEELSAEVKNIDINRWKRIRATNESLSHQVMQEMQRVSGRMEKLAKQQDALKSQAVSLATNMVASASGLPVDMVAEVAQGDLKEAALKYVGSQIDNPSSSLSKELKVFGDSLVESNRTLGQLYDTYKQAEKFKGDVDAVKVKFRDDVELVASAFREPNVERFLKLGEITYNGMPQPNQRAIDQFIEQQKPLKAWVQSAYHKAVVLTGDVDQFRNGIGRIAGDIDRALKDNEENFRAAKADVADLLNQELKKAGKIGEDAVRTYATQLVKSIRNIAMNDEDDQSIFVQVLIVYPPILRQANPNIWNQLKSRFTGASDDQIVQQLVEACKATLEAKTLAERQQIVQRTGLGFEEPGRLTVSGSRYYVTSEILSKLNAVDASKIRPDVANRMTDLVSEITKKLNKSSSPMTFLASAISPETAAAYVSKHIPSIPASSVDKLWTDLKKSSGPFATRVAEGMRQSAAAAIAAPALPSAPPPSLDTSIPVEDPQMQTQKAMSAMALNAAFPGAGVAYELLLNFASMDANRQLNEQLNQQSVQLMAAYQELLRSTADADTNEAISIREYDRAVAQADAAKAQLEQYGNTIDTILAGTKDVDIRLRLYRPYFFYLAELLRQEFDIFDRSLAMWSGQSDSRGFFASQIAADPSLARLALDSEIHLFDWLNRDREATKTDPFALFVHWQQLLTLAENYCADRGCKPGDNLMGQIGVTPRVGLFADIADPIAREAFQRWKQGSLQHPFKATIMIDPSQRLIPARFANVRNLDWNLIPQSSKRQVIGNFVQVQHRGHSVTVRATAPSIWQGG